MYPTMDLHWVPIIASILALISHSPDRVSGTRNVAKRVNFEPPDMTTDEVVQYVHSFIVKCGSSDKINEEYYMNETFAKELYHNIDNLIPVQVFIKWLVKTKTITDKADANGSSMLSKYQSFLNGACSSGTSFAHTIQAILRTWDGDRTIIANDLEDWHLRNEKTPFSEICNRFRGLTCQYKRAVDPTIDHGRSFEITNNTTCQCSGDADNVGFYISSSPSKSLQSDKTNAKTSYPDGCYIRPWKPCKFLSKDTSFLASYGEWHNNLENKRSLLAQMAFPVARTHRCKESTYCLDLVPGLKKPICWCNPDSDDHVCARTIAASKHKVPVGGELTRIRKKFVSLILPANDTRTNCSVEYNQQVYTIVAQAGKDPTRSGVVDLMVQLTANHKAKIRLCDFRQDLFCDPKTATCKGQLDCDLDKVHLAMGVCAVNNGYRCQTNEECIQNARCKFFKGISESACVCHTGYGDRCILHNSAFFAQRFVPLVSGYDGREFIRLQTEINQVLDAWEDRMQRKLGESCDAIVDPDAMQLVRYFGSLDLLEKEKLLPLLGKARQMTQAREKLCLYKKFLRCDTKARKCVPMLGNKMTSAIDHSGRVKIVVEVNKNDECNLQMPMVFQDKVSIICPKGYICKKGNSNTEKCYVDCASSFAPHELCPHIETSTRAPDEITEEVLLESQLVESDVNVKGRSQEFPSLDQHASDRKK